MQWDACDMLKQLIVCSPRLRNSLCGIAARRRFQQSLCLHSKIYSAADDMPVHEPPAEGYEDRWRIHWQQDNVPWDAGKCSPALLQLLEAKQLSVDEKRVLVPGCGRGYDVFAFASAGARAAVGLELCPEAVSAAQAECGKQQQQDSNAVNLACLSEVVAADFFTYSHPSGQPFDVGYDYTFLCALHPSMRKDWAETWARLLAPGGELVTLIFPVGPGFIGNPPWQVSPELYQELLLPGFEQVVLEPVPTELSHKGRAGREWLGRWRRKLTNTSSSSNKSQHAATAAGSCDHSKL